MNTTIPYVYADNSGQKMIDIFSRMLDSRKVFIFGEINEQLSLYIISQLLYLDSISDDPIDLYINSPGGTVEDGLAIIDTMHFIKSKVRTINLGKSYSMAAVILVNGEKGERMALPNASTMLHQVIITGGKNAYQDFKVSFEHTSYINEKLLDILANQTNLSRKDIEKITSRDYYMDNKVALEAGIIDRVILNNA